MPNDNPTLGYRGYPSQRLRSIETRERWKSYNGDPNGNIDAAIGTYCWDYANDDMYVNSDGANTWQLIGGGGGAIPHNILSATHTDSLASAVSRGSLIYGNATPAWAELALGGIAGSVLTRNATDVLWSAGALSFAGAFTLTIPATGTAALGTGAANQVAYWTGTNTIAGDAGFTYDAAADTITLTPAAAGGLTFAGATGRNRIRMPDNLTSGMYFDDAGGLVFADLVSTNANPYFNLFPSGGGKVGIGTTAPATLLNAVSATDAYIQAFGTANNSIARVGARGNVATQFMEFFQFGSAYAGLDTIGVANAGLALVLTGSTTTNFVFRTSSAGNTADILFGAGDGTFADLVIDGPTGYVGVGLGASGTIDRLFHTESSDAATATITYATRTSHTTSGAAAALFGVGHEDELEDSAGNMQVASEQVTLWSVPTSGSESPLLRFTTYPQGTAGPGYCAFWTYTGISGAITVIANGTGDVTECLTCLFSVSAVTAGDVGGGTCVLEPSDSFVLYNDGAGDTLTLAVAADGSVTITEAGGDTFDAGLWMVWH